MPLSSDLMLLVLLPVIGAVIGWLTNFLAVKMLFHPRRPRRILGVTLQGVFPKRQSDFAHQLGIIVARELFEAADVSRVLSEAAHPDDIVEILDRRIEDKLNKKLPKALTLYRRLSGAQLIEPMRAAFEEELKEMLPELIDRIGANLEQRLDVRAMIAEKVLSFSSDKLEQVVFSIMGREFQAIEFMGAGLGFLIGLVQASIVLLLHQP